MSEVSDALAIHLAQRRPGPESRRQSSYVLQNRSDVTTLNEGRDRSPGDSACRGESCNGHVHALNEGRDRSPGDSCARWRRAG